MRCHSASLQVGAQLRKLCLSACWVQKFVLFKHVGLNLDFNEKIHISGLSDQQLQSLGSSIMVSFQTECEVVVAVMSPETLGYQQLLQVYNFMLGLKGVMIQK